MALAWQRSGWHDRLFGRFRGGSGFQDQAEGNFQAVCAQQWLIGQNGAGGSVGNDLALVDEDGSGAEFQDHIQVMGGNELGGRE